MTLQVVGGSAVRRKQVATTARSVLNNNFTEQERNNIGPVTINLNPGNLSGNFVADTTRLKKLFGAVPQTSLETGLLKTYKWLKNAG